MGFLQGLINGMRCGIVAIDRDGRLAMINLVAQQILDLDDAPRKDSGTSTKGRTSTKSPSLNFCAHSSSSIASHAPSWSPCFQSCSAAARVPGWLESTSVMEQDP